MFSTRLAAPLSNQHVLDNLGQSNRILNQYNNLDGLGSVLMKLGTIYEA
jgi:hypothetical protein